MDTRKEELLKGNIDIEPETRKEMFIKHIYDKEQPVPEPETRIEILLNKVAEMVEAPRLISKVITEPGTYRAEEDGADGYREITVLKGD